MKLDNDVFWVSKSFKTSSAPNCQQTSIQMHKILLTRKISFPHLVILKQLYHVPLTLFVNLADYVGHQTADYVGHQTAD